MNSASKTILMGARDSKLSRVQTELAVAELAKLFPSMSFRMIFLSSPGDRNKELDLRSSPDDFFTRDLDDAVEKKQIDCAVHSAKDLPPSPREGLDWFFLPCCEDMRDAIVMPAKKTSRGKGVLRIGVSSERRAKFCLKKFPNARILPIRGNIEERIAKLDAGDFDMIICAAAGLKRLGLEQRISEYIPLEELAVPDGQGRLAITFKSGNPLFSKIRKFFIHPVVFAGAGPGDKKLITQTAREEIQSCDVCLHDSLASDELLSQLKAGARAVHTGKRAGQHSMKQEEINIMIANFARQGMAVLRLKGGDPGIFGRLAEETAVLDSLDLPFRVVPGISSLQAATSSTGMLLTRRGLSRGFSVFTPRKAISGDCEIPSKKEFSSMPAAIFMAKSELEKLSDQLIRTGRKPDETAVIVFNAACIDEIIIHAKLSELGNLTKKTKKITGPGIVLCGENFDKRFLFRKNGLLEGKKILLTCSEEMGEKASREILRLGGIPISMPMIRFETSADTGKLFSGSTPLILKYNWLAITSPASARIFLDSAVNARFDLRRLPLIMSSGPETSKELVARGIFPDIQAERDFGSKGLAEIAVRKLKKGERVARLVSDKSFKKMTAELRRAGILVDEIVLYKTIPVNYSTLPEFDAVFFASPSAAESFKNNFGSTALRKKDVVVLGDVTADALKKIFKKIGRLVVPEQSKAVLAIQTYALQLVSKSLLATD
ncbi:MAG TPA: uroporphyrinogen-III C-methyltransferase [Victivallales bacterium]|nr:uroporphyrinogen-III C-methyltransferase [Victivallales bacterium]